MMINKYKAIKFRAGLSLIEIMLAMAILASAFIPIIGVMGTAAKATDKDNRTIKAMELCQDKLNKALQFPFDGPVLGNTLNPRGGKRTFGTASETIKSGQISLHLGPGELIDGIPFDSTLVSEDIAATFSVPVYDAFEKGEHSTNPDLWGWTDKKIGYTRVFSKYTVTVKWQDAGNNREKYYTLVSFKAKTRTE